MAQRYLPELLKHFFQYASNVHNYNTRYAANQNRHKFRVKTNTGKQMISFILIFWLEILFPHAFWLSSFYFLERKATDPKIYI